MGEKSVGEKSLGENRGRWDAGLPPSQVDFLETLKNFFSGSHREGPDDSSQLLPLSLLLMYMS